MHVTSSAMQVCNTFQLLSHVRTCCACTVLIMPLARLPNRSEDSVSAASAGLGEQHISSVVLALPPSESCMYRILASPYQP